MAAVANVADASETNTSQPAPPATDLPPSAAETVAHVPTAAVLCAVNPNGGATTSTASSNVAGHARHGRVTPADGTRVLPPLSSPQHTTLPGSVDPGSFAAHRRDASTFELTFELSFVFEAAPDDDDDGCATIAHAWCFPVATTSHEHAPPPDESPPDDETIVPHVATPAAPATCPNSPNAAAYSDPGT